ncbi:MAG: hypothetical protein ACLQED_05830 [Desulfobaccales bacterium]
MKKVWILSFLLVLVTGCSVVMATQQPGRKDLSVLSKGVERSRVIAELGSPLITDVVDGKKQDVFAFKQGYSTGAKAGRAVFHGVADVFTLGLWEVVGTPVEAVFHGSEVKVRVLYDKDDKVDSILTYAGKGKVDEATVPAEPAKNPDRE